MGSGEIIKECFLRFLGQCFLQFCFRSQFIEGIDIVNIETAPQIIQCVCFDSLCFCFRYTKDFSYFSKKSPQT